MIKEKSKFRVIITDKNSSKKNMAIDEALLQCYKKGDMPILRLYLWDKNSVTIGVSQHIEDYDFENMAKRITGGGVLFHGQDISYSLVIPSDLLEGFNIKQSYEKICEFLLNFYNKIGLDVCYAKDDKDVKLFKNEYCQVGFEAYDILVNGRKIGGNAQRRTKKAIFQHGSIPIKSVDKSNTFFDKVGISLETIGKDISFEEAKDYLIDSFEQTFNVELIFSHLTLEEKDLIDKLLKEKYEYNRK